MVKLGCAGYTFSLNTSMFWRGCTCGCVFVCVPGFAKLEVSWRKQVEVFLYLRNGFFFSCNTYKQMVFNDTTYGARDWFWHSEHLELHEFINIYGISGLWYSVLHCLVTLRWTLWICFFIHEWFTFMSVLYEAVIDNRLQRGESCSHVEGQQGQGWCFQLPSADSLYQCFVLVVVSQSTHCSSHQVWNIQTIQVFNFSPWTQDMLSNATLAYVCQ